jgi:glyoxylase-like metal-dependent hydrolase (beta-lactamase superfamily II)
MLHIEKMTFNPFQENTYLLYDESGTCVVIDPGNQNPVEDQELLNRIADLKLQPVMIFNTHAHLDHIFGNQTLVDTFHIPVALHEKEFEMYQATPQVAQMYGMPPFETPEPEIKIDVSQPLKVGTEELRILFTPGHSPGEVSLYHEASGQLIAGDVLFRESIGRTDLPGGDYDTLIRSIKEQLLVLPEETKVYSGHGPDTTIGHEKRNNPFLQ